MQGPGIQIETIPESVLGTPHPSPALLWAGGAGPGSCIPPGWVWAEKNLQGDLCEQRR